VCQELQILSVILIILVFLYVFTEFKTIILNLCNILQQNMTSAQVIHKYVSNRCSYFNRVNMMLKNSE
jgi:hypothetical protein